MLRHKGIEIEFRGPQGHANTRMIYITAKVPITVKKPSAPIAITGAGQGSVASAPKEVVPEKGGEADHQVAGV